MRTGDRDGSARVSSMFSSRPRAEGGGGYESPLANAFWGVRLLPLAHVPQSSHSRGENSLWAQVRPYGQRLRVRRYGTLICIVSYFWSYESASSSPLTPVLTSIMRAVIHSVYYCVGYMFPKNCRSVCTTAAHKNRKWNLCSRLTPNTSTRNGILD